MADVICATKSLNTRDWFDYISVLLPLTLSIFAIIIAIVTSQRQNKVALFEKKYSYYSEILGFCTLWRMFIYKFKHIKKENGEVPNDSLCTLCLSIALLGMEESRDVDVTDYINDHKIDRKKIENLIFDLKYKNSMSLEITAFLYGAEQRRIEVFAKQYMSFSDRVIEALNEKITQDEFEKNITIFEERLDAFYKFVFSYMKRKIKLSD